MTQTDVTEADLRLMMEIAMLATMLSSDRPQGTLDALCLPGLSAGMLKAPELFDYATGLFREGCAPVIAFNGADGRAHGKTVPGEAWPGKDYYITEFLRRGVPAGCLVATGPGNHTGEETLALIKTAKERGWKRLGFITIPYHFPRAFCFLVKAMQVHDYYPAIWALNPPSTGWYLEMGASQGNGTTTSEFAARADFEKLPGQIKNGWAASPPYVLEYLRARKH